MSSEYHIIIIWEKARKKQYEIELAIKNELIILQKYEYQWNQERANENYAIFYGEKLDDIQYKVEHCGKGKFMVYLVEDNNPIYQIRNTTSGARIVNINLFDLKSQLRKIAGGGHQVHSSDNPVEANTNAVSLFKKNIIDVVSEVSDKYTAFREMESPCIKIKRNVAGVGGWKDWNEFFKVLNAATKYVVLRNFETIVWDVETGHGDVDLLVYDKEAASTIIAGNKIFQGKTRVLYAINVAGTKEQIDLRYYSDGYYCRKWEENIIQTRGLHDSGSFYIPNDENYKYMLLYHALVHKPILLTDYKKQLFKLYKLKSETKLRKELHIFMESNDYEYSLPDDKSVYIHPAFFNRINIPFLKRVYCYLKMKKYLWRKEEPANESATKKISTFFSGGYCMVGKIFQKIKARVRTIRSYKC